MGLGGKYVRRAMSEWDSHFSFSAMHTSFEFAAFLIILVLWGIETKIGPARCQNLFYP